MFTDISSIILISFMIVFGLSLLLCLNLDNFYRLNSVVVQLDFVSLSSVLNYSLVFRVLLLVFVSPYSLIAKDLWGL